MANASSIREGSERHQPAQRAARARIVLSVGLSDTTLKALPPHVLKPASRLSRIAFDDLAALRLEGPRAPSLILTPLVTTSFDALDMACHLMGLGYSGRYLALATALPDAPLIRREVALHAPAVSFDVVVLDGRSLLHGL